MESHYARNKVAYLQRAAEQKRRARAFINEKKSAPCVDCGKTYPPYVMDFDHVPERGPKEFDIGPAVSQGQTPKRIEAELEKCDLVCCNCHRIRTHERKVAAQQAS